MYHLARIFPSIREWHIPLTRDQIMMLMIATNLLFLGVDTYLVHAADGTIRPNEWTPIIFGPLAGVLLFLSGLLALRRRQMASVIATLTLIASIGVGVLGAYLHFIRGILPDAPPGQQVSIDLLIWAPPILGPLMFAIVGIFGLGAVWIEKPADSGDLIMWGDHRFHLPYSKTQAYFYTLSMAALVTLVSSVLDHARLQFSDPWLWLPTVVGIFGTVIAAIMGMIEKPNRGDLITYIVTMLLFIAVGLIGAWLHFEANLVAEGTIVQERFLRGSPILAPMLFANVGAFGLIILLDPVEHPEYQLSERKLRS